MVGGGLEFDSRRKCTIQIGNKELRQAPIQHKTLVTLQRYVRCKCLGSIIERDFSEPQDISGT